jgi:hypothetical protein
MPRPVLAFFAALLRLDDRVEAPEPIYDPTQ